MSRTSLSQTIRLPVRVPNARLHCLIGWELYRLGWRLRRTPRAGHFTAYVPRPPKRSACSAREAVLLSALPRSAKIAPSYPRPAAVQCVKVPDGLDGGDANLGLTYLPDAWEEGKRVLTHKRTVRLNALSRAILQRVPPKRRHSAIRWALERTNAPAV